MRAILYAFGAAAFISLCVIIVILKIQQDGLKKELEGKPCVCTYKMSTHKFLDQKQKQKISFQYVL